MIYFFIRSIFSEIKMDKVNRQKGFSQILLLIIISFFAIALPITTRLVQQSQENRSSAATESTYSGGGCGSYTYGQCISQGSSSCSWDSKNQRCVAKSNSAKISTSYTCTSGSNTYQVGEKLCYTGNAWTCKSDGTFSKETCANGCRDGKCASSGEYACASGQNLYKTGEKLCYTGNAWTCKSDGTFSKETCAHGCLDGSCISTTTCSLDGTTYTVGNHCNGSNLITCSTTGTATKKSCGTAGCNTTKNECNDSTTGSHYWVKGSTGASCAQTVKTYTSVSACSSDLGVTCYSSEASCPSSSTTTCANTTGRANDCSCTTATQCASKVCYSNICTAGRQYWFYNGSKCTQTGDSYKDLSSCTGNVRSTCYSTEADCNKAHNVASQKYWFYNGSKCVLTGDSYASATLCSNNTRSTCYGTEAECNSHIACTSGSKQCSGDYVQTCTNGSWITATTKCSYGCANGACETYGGGGGDYTTPVCTANTVSTTECYDSTHLKKCNSDGSAWIQGDQCPTGKACQNGVCGGIGAKLSFRIAFDGVAPANLSCLDNFKTINLTVGTVGTTLTQQLSVDVTKTDLTTSKGYSIFGADNVVLGTGFSGATNVYARIKGQVHARMYYCVKSQSAKSTSQVCNLSLDGTVNNFYEYPILGGDVNQDGVVNTADFSMIKIALSTTGCGIKSDLNGDGIVNGPDIKIFKVALEAKYDE